MIVKERKISDSEECDLLIDAISARINYHETCYLSCLKGSNKIMADYNKSKLSQFKKVLRDLFDVASSFKKEGYHGE